ncbi:uncharacterized protein LOC130796955 [Amaranthus tricolor]|uniref:uncharacterized protein LOC130796955 n=1 Tax=Amaranthus tricolor TaxID=29722 RepID=UPI002584A997|nr:uncharacterized protein LOC130796955 [Amaranthus tricolor]
MSTAKIIFTYKRRRLSSRSGVDHGDVCSDFSLDVKANKHLNVTNETIKIPAKDLRILEHVSCNDVDLSTGSCHETFDNQYIDFQFQRVGHGKTAAASCSSVGLCNSSAVCGKTDTDLTNTRKMIVDSLELPVDDTFKTSGKCDSVRASLGEITSSIKKISCLLHPSTLEIEEHMQGGSVFHSAEKNSQTISKQSNSSKSEVVKGTAVPLRTFSRRLKRKVDKCGTGLFAEPPLREKDAAIEKCDSVPIPSCTCEVASNESNLVDKSQDLKVENNGAGTMDMLCQSCKKIVSSEIGESSCPCRWSCAGTPILKQTDLTNKSSEDLVSATSPVIKQTTIKTSGSIDSSLHYPGGLGSTTNLPKNDFRCSSNDGTVVSCHNVVSKTDEQPVSQQLRACSGDSQVTSSKSSDLNRGADEIMEHRSHSNSLDLSLPPPGAFVIDCNLVPQEVSDDVHESATTRNNTVMQEGCMKSKGLELFGDTNMQVEDSLDSSNKMEIKPKTKYLQLFSEERKSGELTTPNTHPKIGHNKAHQMVELSLHSQSLQLEQSSCKASSDLGLSLPTERILEGRTFKDGPTVPHFQNPNMRLCDFKPNPVMQPFLEPASFRHKLLLESINTRATSLMGNRNISLEMFEPCRSWSEEELDSLWIGIRRHGRGHWRAMLLDPKLRFAPWRLAGELEEQWEREQYRLFSVQPMPPSRYLKPQEGYNFPCHGPTMCPGTSRRRENFVAETQLSLGDLYSQKADVSFGGIAQNHGIPPVQRHVTMASCGIGSYSCCSLNNVQANVMIRGTTSPHGPRMASGMTNLPHWLKDPINTPLRSLDVSPPPISTPQMGGVQLVHAFPESSGTSCRGENVIDSEPTRANPLNGINSGTPVARKPGMADNLIVIDSDASSEETISDDHNLRS